MSARNLFMIVSLVLSILIGLAIARSGRSGPQQGELLIGLSMATLQEARWQQDMKLFVKRCEELGAKVMVQSANDDDVRQLQDCQSLITAGAKVLVIVPHDGKSMARAVEAAHKDHIPVIAYDRMITDCDLDLYMSFDNVKVGELQARYLVEHLPGAKGKIVRVYGAPTDNNAKLFKQGQDNVLKPYLERGDIVVVHEDWAENWQPAKAKQIVEAAITRQGGVDFQGVLASNDGTAGGAIQALGDKTGQVLVTGQDAELAAVQRIAGGTQTMTIYKPLRVLATRAADAAVRLAQYRTIAAGAEVPNGKIKVPSILCEVVTVTKDNVVDTVIKDDFLKYDEVYRGVPENQRPARP